MCGRVQLTHTAADIAEFFGVSSPAELALQAPRYNVAPGARLPVLRLDDDEERELVALRWGLVPPWAKDEKIGYRMINARSETAAEKPSFRSAWKRRRCAVAASAYYEWWRRRPKARPERAFRLHPVDEPMFAFAGLWERWDRGDGGPLDTCTILTRNAAPGLQAIHDRQPVLLSRDTLSLWLEAGSAPSLEAIVASDRTGVRVAVDEVSTHVNDARNDDPACIEPSPPLGLAERLMQRRGWSDGFEATAFGPQPRWRDPDTGEPGRLDPEDPGLARTLLAEMDAASVDVTSLGDLEPAEIAEAWLTWQS
jgi:putative SOS response-associated peptidase YedK